MNEMNQLAFNLFLPYVVDIVCSLLESDAIVEKVSIRKQLQRINIEVWRLGASTDDDTKPQSLHAITQRERDYPNQSGSKY